MPNKQRPRGRTLFALTLVAAAATHGASAASADAAAQPWRNATQSPAVRAQQLLAAMNQDQKIALISAIDPADYKPLEALGIPAMTRVDASAGLRGDRGVTAFPVPIALAATFDTQLGREVGAAIGQEARGKGWNVILGPTVDVARDPRSGRLGEGFGEDPKLSAAFGVAVAGGMQSQDVIVMAKHYTAYQTERDRLHMNVDVTPRVLQEVYNVPFAAMIDQAHITSLMASYPKINGTFAMENKPVIDLLKNDLKFEGYLATDFLGGADGVAQINAGVDSWSLQPFLRAPQALRDKRVPQARIDDAVRRTLWALFASGTFDRPLPPLPLAVVTTPQHQALALREATESTVLLKNDGGTLPLQRKGRVAVIGPADRDLVTGVMWSSWVEPGAFQAPVDAIAEVGGSGVEVVQEQGSVGDIPLPLLSPNDGDFFGAHAALQTPDGQKGWQLELFANADRSGPPVARSVTQAVDVPGKPLVSLPDKWSARWTARLAPQEDGAVRLSALVSGTVRVSVDGRPVIDGMRSTASNFAGGGPLTYPIQAMVDLKRDKPVTITVDYTTTGAFSGPQMHLGWQPSSRIAAAVKLARQSDVAVVFVNQATGEEMDRDNLAIPGDQDALVEAVAAANPNTVVVLNTGGPVKMPWLSRVKSVVQMWYPGSAGGRGIARVLFGDAEPGGRLPVTFPADEAQGPARYAGGLTQAFSEGVFVGHSWYEKNGQKPLFPFGHGLSYTSFAIDGLQAQSLEKGREEASVSVRVANTGKRAGSTVVQVYGGPLPTAVETPSRLLGFARVELQPGESRQVEIPIERRSLSLWSEPDHRWVTPVGNVPVRVGQSAEATPLKTTLVVR